MQNHTPADMAIVYCEKAFNTTNGKTAHGLVRFTRRYEIAGVIDSHYAGRDAGMVLDGVHRDIPIFADLTAAVTAVEKIGRRPTHFVIGLAPDGGRLEAADRRVVQEAIEAGLNVDAGLHDFLSEYPLLADAANCKGIKIRDIRKPPPRQELHFFSGKIETVACLKIAVLGTDSAVGKRTTAWLAVEALNKAGYTAELIGTGQTAWLQGARYSIILDSLVNDFVSGEIEHAVWSAWNEQKPEAIIIEGQGSLMNPAYPGGFEILAAGRPDAVILQHAPARTEYDGFPGYRLHPLKKQIDAIEFISGKPVVCICINHENLSPEQVPDICASIQAEIGLPTFDVLLQGVSGLTETLISRIDKYAR